jgi:hypothetical protein
MKTTIKRIKFQGVWYYEQSTIFLPSRFLFFPYLKPWKVAYIGFDKAVLIDKFGRYQFIEGEVGEFIKTF